MQSLSVVLYDADKHVYIDVPYSDKDDVKANGSFWDGETKKWFVLNSNTDLIKKYPMRKIYFIEVPYDGKDEAKAQGARWNVEAKKWYTYDITKNTFPIL
jgi:hypothetical protein